MSILKRMYLLRVSELVCISICILIIQACSNTTIGQDLSDSFDSPEKNDMPEDKLISKNNNLILKTTQQEIQTSLNPRDNISKKKFRSQKKLSNFIPQPYRITIKLSAANPSAPAERVTQALRTAGVTFEVEKIEIISEQSSIKKSQSGMFKR